MALNFASSKMAVEATTVRVYFRNDNKTLGRMDVTDADTHNEAIELVAKSLGAKAPVESPRRKKGKNWPVLAVIEGGKK